MMLPNLAIVLGVLLGASEAQDRTLEHNGKSRTYRLCMPASATKGKPIPLVIVLHGAGANGKITEALTGFTPVADRNGFAVVYPDGLNGLWRFWETARAQATPKDGQADDIGFIDAIITQLKREGIADGQRVYVTGISNGAYMAHRLACELPN